MLVVVVGGGAEGVVGAPRAPSCRARAAPVTSSKLESATTCTCANSGYAAA